MTVVAFTLHVLVEQALDDVRLQLLACAGPCIEERVSRELSQRPAEPVAERNPEPGLASCGDLRWNE